VLFDEARLAAKVRELGARLAEEYSGRDPILVGVLNGAAVFLSDLARACPIPLRVDFIAVSSYGKGTSTSGVVRFLKDLDRTIEGQHVVVVEDIVDTGLTLSYLLESLRARRPASLRVCALLDKRERRTVDVALDWVGFETPDEFVVGYGLDFADYYRNLPYIGVLKPELYTG
jgi:hypoxanthine phosphoribosyltransferase